MLRELVKTRQIDGEAPRKWYFSHELDLVVWFDPHCKPYSFQLAYAKYHGEHSISWHREKGYQHYVVDDGEGSYGKAQTPFLYSDGAFSKDKVLQQFLELSNELPAEVIALVTKALRDYAEPTIE